MVYDECSDLIKSECLYFGCIHFQPDTVVFSAPLFLYFSFKNIFGFSAMGHDAIMITFGGESTRKELSGVSIGLLFTMISAGIAIGPSLLGYTVNVIVKYA